MARVGPAKCYAEKTRIVFQTRARFLAVMPRRPWLACHLWMKRERAHPLYHRVDALAGRDFVHHFRISSVEELDDRRPRELLGRQPRTGGVILGVRATLTRLDARVAYGRGGP